MNSATVSTTTGKVQGKLVEVKNGKSVHIYRNIPFAKPPTGSLRFMPPVPADSWDGVRDATKVGNKPWCVEMIGEKDNEVDPLEDEAACDEDCLHVNVYSPSPEKGKSLPVMVWIYGGGFQMGSEEAYNGTLLAGLHEVVVVVPNYRVGVFGFLSLGPESSCPGNYGLMDQQQALRWVQENIEEFGGDKNNVTIFGESAGGASVHFHVISPLSRGLFHKAISHSGQAKLTEFASEEQRKRSSERLAKHLKLDVTEGPGLAKELRKIPAKDIMDAIAAIEMVPQDVSFTPYIDGKVDDVLDAKEFVKVPYIIGFNDTEGSGILSQSSGKDFLGGYTEEEARNGLFIKMTDEGYEKCKKQYLREEHGDQKFSRLLCDVLGDGAFIAPGVHSAIKHAESGADVFVYLGAFQLKMHHDDEYGGEVQKKANWCHCDHGDNVPMTFGTPLTPETATKGAKFSEDEEYICRGFMTYQTNFAKTGNPNEGSEVPTRWPKYKPYGEHLVVAKPFSTGKNLGEKEVKFWIEDMKPYLK